MRLVRYTYPSFRSLAPVLGTFPRSPLSGFEAEIDRLFEAATAGGASSRRFPIDLYEDKANTYVRAQLPGVTRDNIQVEFSEGALTVAVTPAAPAAAESGADAQPKPPAAITRTVNIADDVRADQVTATFENGVLTVTLPKQEPVQPRKIAVTVK